MVGTAIISSSGNFFAKGLISKQGDKLVFDSIRRANSEEVWTMKVETVKLDDIMFIKGADYDYFT